MFVFVDFFLILFAVWFFGGFGVCYFFFFGWGFLGIFFPGEFPPQCFLKDLDIISFLEQLFMQCPIP